jgi:protein gp37
VPPFLASHTHPTGDVHKGVITRVKGKWVFNGKLTAQPDGHRSWTFPLDWKGAEHPKRGPGRQSLIFVVDAGDLFIEGRPDDLISRVIATVVASRYGHIAELVTKRTERMAQFLTTLNPRTIDRWQPRIWTGFSAENQEWFDRRWEDMRRLVDTGWFTFVSLALLGPVILPDDFLSLGKRTWVIVGGEHRVPGARDMDPMWARSIRDQCKSASASAGIPFFFKQMTKDAPIPPDLVGIRQFPALDV